MTCDYCGRPLVEVDNPFRREVRHRRGQECSGTGPTIAELVERAGITDAMLVRRPADAGELRVPRAPEEGS